MSFGANIHKTTARVNSFNRGKLKTVANRVLEMKRHIRPELQLSIERYLKQEGHTKEGYTEDMARECLYMIEQVIYWELSDEERNKEDTNYMKKH
jgi:hypothetical protein